MVEQTTENNTETNNAIADAMQDIGTKTAEYVAQYLEAANERILQEALEGHKAAEEIVSNPADAYRQA
ncbi:hypothetical protein [Sedimenticola thiotaurini]|uniref:Uncharacterized protein n=1 Tax=Sedimenticola thiotaurini TaxID=1543721 RepID=A0A0F7K4L3_9GAMM|nr:hypothetical protein [Sedimenticola thiotaurini]AKH21918.1 hypothetical protein AAY24_17965 [Sedimenticola thiotaurini]